MTAILNYTCNLCFHTITGDGLTLLYVPDNGDTTRYHLSSIEKGLKPMTEQLSATNGIVYHHCVKCAGSIHDEVAKARGSK